jgi:hypothetical protein
MVHFINDGYRTKNCVTHNMHLIKNQNCIRNILKRDVYSALK